MQTRRQGTWLASRDTLPGARTCGGQPTTSHTLSCCVCSYFLLSYSSLLCSFQAARCSRARQQLRGRDAGTNPHCLLLYFYVFGRHVLTFARSSKLPLPGGPRPTCVSRGPCLIPWRTTPPYGQKCPRSTRTCHLQPTRGPRGARPLPRGPQRIQVPAITMLTPRLSPGTTKPRGLLLLCYPRRLVLLPRFLCLESPFACPLTACSCLACWTRTTG